jgi:preprotein translocase subunit SecA
MTYVIALIMIWAFVFAWIAGKILCRLDDVLQRQQLLILKENQQMATENEILAAVAAAVADVKAAINTAIEKEKAEVLAKLQALIDAGGNFSAADLTTVLDSIKSIGTAATAQVDQISEVQPGTGTGGGGTGQPLP